MKIDKYVKTRVFNITDITEKEGLVLRTLLNLSKAGVIESLKSDSGYWEDEIEEKEAIEIGVDVCSRIMEMVDEE